MGQSHKALPLGAMVEARDDRCRLRRGSCMMRGFEEKQQCRFIGGNHADVALNRQHKAVYSTQLYPAYIVMVMFLPGESSLADSKSRCQRATERLFPCSLIPSRGGGEDDCCMDGREDCFVALGLRLACWRE